MIAHLLAWLRSVASRRAAEREMHEEMQSHLARATDRFVSRGMSIDEARLAARREFGNVGVIQEESRDARGGRWIETTANDARYAARALRRSPVFTITVVLSLALGIGANTAIFGVIYALVLERLPIAQPEQLVELRRAGVTSPPGDAFWMGEYDALAGTPGIPIAAFTGSGARPVVIAGAEEPNIGEMVAVDGNYFSLLGIRLSAGRVIGPSDDEARAPVLVLSYDLAVRRFGSPAKALGQIVSLNRASFTIIGIAPPAFHGLGIAGSFGMATPLRAATQLLMSPDRLARGLQVTIVARAIDRTTAESAIDRVFQRCCANGERAPAIEGRVPARGQHLQLDDVSRGIPPGKGDARAQYSRTLYLLMGGVAVLLLIACANVGNLLLARASSRARELAVRLSLGASRGRIVRQLLIETLELSIAGAVAGFALAVWGTGLLAQHLPSSLSLLRNVLALRPNPALFGFTAAVTMMSAAVFGVLPALTASRIDLARGLRDLTFGSARRRGYLDRGVVAAQVALALVLVFAAALLASTLRNLLTGNAGFESSHMLIADTEVRDTRYAQTGMRPLHGEMLRRIRSLAGVRAAGMATRVPMAYGCCGSPDQVDVPGYRASDDEDMNVDFISATPGYLAGAGIAIRRGRDFTVVDDSGAPPVVIVNDAFVRKYLAGRDPIGLTFRHHSDFSPGGPITVIAVAADAKYYDLRGPAQPTAYVPFAQAKDWGFLAVAVRTSVDPITLAPAVREAMLSAAPGVTVRWVQPMQSMLDTRLAREHTLSWLVSMFAVLAVIIAAVGLYGVQAYHVTARTPEIGIRMALGADRRRVVWMVLRQSLGMIVAGVLAGVPLAIAGGRAIGAQLYDVTPWQPEVLLGAVVLLCVVGIAASLLPAGRAARVDPLLAIRAE